MERKLSYCILSISLVRKTADPEALIYQKIHLAQPGEQASATIALVTARSLHHMREYLLAKRTLQLVLHHVCAERRCEL